MRVIKDNFRTAHSLNGYDPAFDINQPPKKWWNVIGWWPRLVEWLYILLRYGW